MNNVNSKIMGGIKARMIALAGESKVNFNTVRVVVGDSTADFDIRFETSEVLFTEQDNLITFTRNMVSKKTEELNLPQDTKDSITLAIIDNVLKAFKMSLKEGTIQTEVIKEELSSYGAAEGEIYIASFVTDGDTTFDIKLQDEYACRGKLTSDVNSDEIADVLKQMKENREMEKNNVRETETTKEQDVNISKSFCGFNYTRVKNDKENKFSIKATNPVSKIASGIVIGASIGLAVAGLVSITKAIFGSDKAE